jgi:hypothetical protein
MNLATGGQINAGKYSYRPKLEFLSVLAWYIKIKTKTSFKQHNKQKFKKVLIDPLNWN